ncbi:ABC transporter permease [Nanchangia anserum]|uniref:ABC transporter permease n=1 Tax=Nanchangia anserum TaxID=2692125 RepID=A0A8I0GDW3_9ACTO|nr:ABC transporter permease [Nanchangia anserum]MBD3689067.1 ABC transporter permease [Nanchangia anserum]QOX81308.1 ABC transporter permease [Nanchangia anserum]
MLVYLIRRLLNYCILLIIAITLAYVIASVALNPLAIFDWTNPSIDRASVLRTLSNYNINPEDPVFTRFANWLGNIVTSWDWGKTPKGASINEEVSVRIWVSIRLIIIGTFLGMAGGVALGAWSAVRKGTLTDKSISVLALIFISTPPMVLAVVLQILAVKFNLATNTNFFEFIGETGNMGSYPGAALVDRLQHLLLPTLSLSLMNIATYSRYQRNLMLDTLGADYVRTARAKGLRKGKAVSKHALRNAMIPMVTYFAFAVATVFLGAAITEQLFGWHGLGVYGVQSITGQDINGTVCVVAFSGVCVLAGALLSDILVAAVDPRVRTN